MTGYTTLGPRSEERTCTAMKRILLALCLALAPLPLFADDAAKQKQGPYVVMVGVSNYDDKAIQPRPTADADAKALHELFTDAQYGGVAKDRAALLTSNGDK